MANLVMSWDKRHLLDNFELRTDPFQVVSVTKKNSVWIKELDIQIGDILFIETNNMIHNSGVPHFKVVNMSAQLQRSGSMRNIQPFIPKGPFNGIYRNDYLELKPLTWKTVTDEQIDYRYVTKDKETQLDK